MRIKLYQVDAFTDTVFHGNPAGVCILEEWLEEPLMQHIAMENNHRLPQRTSGYTSC